MVIDRTRFLMLTSAIAAACTRGPVASGGRPAGSDLAQADAGEPVTVETPEPEGEIEEEPEPVATGGDCDFAGRMPTCDAMRLPGPTCEQGLNVPPKVCNALPKVLKPRLAADLMTCLVDRSQQGGSCGPDDWVGDCAERTLQRVCSLERAFEKECAELETRCSRFRTGTVTKDRCVRLVSAVLPSEQKSALTCVTEGCGVDYCLTSLAWGKTY